MNSQCNPIPENEEINYGIDPTASLPNPSNEHSDQMVHNSIASSIDDFLTTIERLFLSKLMKPSSINN